MYQPEKVVTSVSTESKQREVGYLGKQVFELSNHLGNILATISDKKLQVSTNTTSTDYFEADVQTVQDYYAFGMQMPGRKLSGGYRYGFGGQEADNEVYGQGNAYTAKFWEYDPRLGRRWNIDPVPDPSQSSYACFNNNPIAFNDVNGDCPDCPDEEVKSKYLGGMGVNMGSFGNGVADGFIGALPDVVGFAWDMLTDGGARDEFMAGMQTLMADPLGAIKAIAGEKYDLYASVLKGEGTEQQQYEVGKEIGNMLFGVATGGAAAKLTEVIKVAKFEKQLAKVAKQADEVTGNAKNAQDKGRKAHAIVESVYKKKGRGEQGYLDGDAVDGYRKKGTSNPDVRYSKNKNKPKIVYDYKTSGNMSKTQLNKYEKNLPKGTIIKEMSKDAKGNYRAKTVGKVR